MNNPMRRRMAGHGGIRVVAVVAALLGGGTHASAFQGGPGGSAGGSAIDPVVAHNIELLKQPGSAMKGLNQLRELPAAAVVSGLEERCFSDPATVGTRFRSRAYEALEAVGAEATDAGFERLLSGLKEPEGVWHGVRALGRVDGDDRTARAAEGLSGVLLEYAAGRATWAKGEPAVVEPLVADLLRSLARMKHVEPATRAYIQALVFDATKTTGLREAAAECFVMTAEPGGLSEVSKLSGDDVADAALAAAFGKWSAGVAHAKSAKTKPNAETLLVARSFTLAGLQSGRAEVTRASLVSALSVCSETAIVERNGIREIDPELQAALGVASELKQNPEVAKMASETLLQLQRALERQRGEKAPAGGKR